MEEISKEILDKLYNYLDKNIDKHSLFNKISVDCHFFGNNSSFLYINFKSFEIIFSEVGFKDEIYAIKIKYSKSKDYKEEYECSKEDFYKFYNRFYIKYFIENPHKTDFNYSLHKLIEFLK